MTGWRIRLAVLTGIGAAFMTFAPFGAHAEKRFALVIGISVRTRRL